MQRGQTVGVHQVGRDRGDILPTKLVDERLQRGGPACGHDDTRAMLDQRSHERPADAIRSSRHPDHRVAKFHGLEMPQRQRFVNATVRD